MRCMTWMVLVLCANHLFAEEKIVAIEKIAETADRKYEASFPSYYKPAAGDWKRAREAMDILGPIQMMQAGNQIEKIERFPYIIVNEGGKGATGICYKVVFAGPNPQQKDIAKAKEVVRFLLKAEAEKKDPLLIMTQELQPQPQEKNKKKFLMYAN